MLDGGWELMPSGSAAQLVLDHWPLEAQEYLAGALRLRAHGVDLGFAKPGRGGLFLWFGNARGRLGTGLCGPARTGRKADN